MKNLIEISHDSAVDLALVGYVGQRCTECNHKFDSVRDIKERELVCSKKDENGLGFACKECFAILLKNHEERDK